MHKLLVALALIGLMALAGTANAVRQDPTKKPGTLKLGDPAPALKASKWLQGKEVKSFESGKVYVVEFWATWCGPCIVMMPHMAELQDEFRDKGVTFIGFSAKDKRGNTEDKVTAFVKKRGPKLNYTFAFADNQDTYEAWMTASGQGGIPCSFVVDKAGKIAYIGHPMYLDVVLPRVVAGKWDIAKSKEEVAGIEKEVNDIFKALNDRTAEAKAKLKKVQDFETKHPALSKIPYFLGPKLNLMMQSGQEKEARKMAEAVMKGAAKHGDGRALWAVSEIMRSGKAKENKELMALSLKAAQAMLEVEGEKDALALYNLAETYFEMGDTAKARDYGKKAVEAADNPGLKQALEQRTKRYGADKK
jgi:thiol-disulfide isomerase/thioredoxin